MKKDFYLLTLDYENYTLNKFIYNDPICLGTTLKNIEKSLKKCNIDECYTLLKEIGKDYYSSSGYKIELLSYLDDLIFNNINDAYNISIVENFSINFNTNIYDKICYDNNDLLISWLNKYGIQTVTYNVYEDIKKIKFNNFKNNDDEKSLLYLIAITEKYEFEVLPIINLALSIYFISLINSTLNTLLNSKSKSYSYNKLDNILAPFPNLYKYYQNNCITEQEVFNGYENKDTTGKRYIYQCSKEFINILTNYLLKLYAITKTYLDMIELPSKENEIVHTMPVVSNKLSEYKNIDFITQKEIHHNILQACCYKLSDEVVNFLPKCLKCGQPTKNNKYYCVEHLIEYAEHKIKAYKGKDVEGLNKMKIELEHLKTNDSYPIPTILKFCAKDVANKKYDLKRKNNN